MSKVPASFIIDFVDHKPCKADASQSIVFHPEVIFTPLIDAFIYTLAFVGAVVVVIVVVRFIWRWFMNSGGGCG